MNRSVRVAVLLAGAHAAVQLWRRRTLASVPASEASDAVTRALQLAEEWDALADACQRRTGRTCPSCVDRRKGARQLRERLTDTATPLYLLPVEEAAR